ncbi:hypothetical protein QQF73_04500 [Marinobacter sp. M216]|uniref:Uncharacterized protein n=1 Tax=Marinobacter albus TaxID=3030833 RepID=A0ABT7H954_9GAMM|nr:hypothetical protein [Marinobacter sp. M216]MDK9556875.1 hypothetical protein [Marinobacter sp. M216]
MMTNLPFSQACENNKAPIPERLRDASQQPAAGFQAIAFDCSH